MTLGKGLIVRRDSRFNPALESWHNLFRELLQLFEYDRLRVIGDDVPGPITRSLQAAWSEMVGVDFVDQALNYKPAMCSAMLPLC